MDTLYPVNAVAGAPAYSGRMLRQANSVFLAGATAARPLGARSGVRPGTSTTTVTATSTTWTCGAFAGVIDGEAAAEAGPYLFSFDAAATGTMVAANASNPRVDIIYVQVDDPSESDGTSAPAVRRGYLAGVAAATPDAPAAPARSFVVAQINVPKSGGGAPTVTWVAPALVAAGGSATPRFAEAAGDVTVAASGPTVISFPPVFTVPPNVQLQVLTAAGGVVGVPWILTPASASAIGVSIFTLGGAQVSGTMSWTAVQATETSAAG